MRFALTKWYVDIVTDDGRAAIAYWAAVRAGRLHHSVCGLLRADRGPAAGAFTPRRVPAPAFRGDLLDWTCAPLDLRITLTRLDRPWGARLLARDDGVLDWCAEAPRARVRLTSGGDTLEGLGYAERLEMTVAPWSLPLHTLRWGRWLSLDHAVVWIVWRGEHPLNLVWLDGTAAPSAVVDDHAVDLGDGRRLTLAEDTAITDATVGAQLAALPALRRLVERVAGSHQTRWRARGVLHGPSGEIARGWAIHEEVRWR